MNSSYVFTSESVTEGHPDKVCDYIADSILDAYIGQRPSSRVACEVLCKGREVVVAGEITSKAEVDILKIVRNAIDEIGYTDPNEAFRSDNICLHTFLSVQSPEIAQGVRKPSGEQGAGDQGLMFGYATNETDELMPLPILLAHRLAAGLASDRRDGNVEWLRPDGKTQVSVRYEGEEPVEITDIVVSTQHTEEVGIKTIRNYVVEELLPEVLQEWWDPEIRVHVNPTGSFVRGGPSADAGVTGRKIIVDTYGGFARHGGGAFSGKDPSKVDRSAAYFCRYVARQVVKEKLADRVEIQVAYAIGEAQPLSLKVDTFGTGDTAAATELVKKFDFRPGAIIERLGLLRPIYRDTTNYGHFGRAELPWEQ